MRRVVAGVLAVLMGCGGDPPIGGGDPEPQEFAVEVKGAAGLFLSPSQAAGAPAGSMLAADNISIRRPGVAETRRGEQAVTALAGRTVLAAYSWQGALITYESGGTLARTVGNVRTAYPGTYQPPPGGAVRFLEAANNLLFTTSTGVFRLDALDGTPTLTGVPKGLLGRAAPTGTSGFLPSGRTVAYRDVWGTRDANDRLLLGAPSDRVTVTNPRRAVVAGAVSRAAGSNTVTVALTAHGYTVGQTLAFVFGGGDQVFFPNGVYTVVTVPTANTFTISVPDPDPVSATVTGEAALLGYATVSVERTLQVPASITTTHFVQVYRSNTPDSSDESPSDELAQVYEVFPTDAEVSARTLNFMDVAADSFGANLYTNPISGTANGVLGGNERPPVSRVLANYLGHTLYADVEGIQRMSITLLGVGAPGGLVSGNGVVLIANDGTRETYTALPAENIPAKQFMVTTSGGAAQNIRSTIQSLVRTINGQASGQFYAYDVSTDDAPGALIIEPRDLSDPAFVVHVTGGPGTMWAPAVPAEIEAEFTARSGGVSIVTVANLASAEFLAPGMKVERLSNGDPDFPVTTITVANVYPPATPGADPWMFDYIDSSPDDSSGPQTYVVVTPEVRSTGESGGNVYAWSNALEPDHVPIANYGRIPDASAVIKWAVPLGSTLIIGTTSGKYRVTGSSPSDFDVRLVDPDFRASGSGLVAILGDYGYSDTDRGVVSFSEFGNTDAPVSVRIEEQLRALRSSLGTTYASLGFMVAYPQENELYLWLPSQASDTTATQAYVYNRLTDTWVRRTDAARTAVVGPGIIGSTDAKTQHLLLAQPTSGVYQERNTGTDADYVLADSAPVPVAVTYLPTDAGDANSTKVWSHTWFYTQGAQPAAAQVLYSTEIVPAPTSYPLVTSPVPYAPIGALWNVADQAHGRSRYLTVGFSAAVPTKTELLGYGQRARITGGAAVTR